MFFEPGTGGTLRFRFSVGDKVAFSSRLLDREGGSRVGTLYGELAVVKGRTFRDAVFLAHAVYQLTDGQIVVDGIYNPSKPPKPIPIIGGAGAYEGVLGSLVTTEGKTGSLDTLHLLP